MAGDGQAAAECDRMVRGGSVNVADEPRVDAGERRERHLVAAVAADRSRGGRARIGGPGRSATGSGSPIPAYHPQAVEQMPTFSPARRPISAATTASAASARAAAPGSRSAATANRARAKSSRRKLVRPASKLRNSDAMASSASPGGGQQVDSSRRSNDNSRPKVSEFLGCPNCGRAALLAAPEGRVPAPLRFERRGAALGLPARIALAPDLLLDAALGTGRTPLGAGQEPLADHGGRRPVLVPHATNGTTARCTGQAGALPGR
jgi:hypothetical protein